MGIKGFIDLSLVDWDEKPKAEECVELAKYYCHIIRTLGRVIPIKTSAEIQNHERGS